MKNAIYPLPLKNYKKPRLLRWQNGIYGLLLAAAMILVYAHLPLSNAPGWHDFHAFYEGGRLLAAGLPLYDGDGRAYIYPPFFAFLMMPFHYFTEFAALKIWSVINVLLLIMIAVFSVRICRFAFKINCTRWQAIVACALTILLMNSQITYEFREGQSDLLILLGFTLAFYWLREKPKIAGFCLGIVTTIKYEGLFLLPLLLLRARWRMLLGLAGGVLAGALLPAVVIGWQRNLAYWQIALRGMTHAMTSQTNPNLDTAAVPNMLWESNIGISSSLSRLFYHHGWTIQSAIICTTLLAMLIFLLLWRIFRRNELPFIWRPALANSQQENAVMFLEWNTLLICMFIFSPECLKRHLILAFPLNLLAILMLLFPRPQMQRWPIAVALLFSLLGGIFIKTAGFNTDYYGLNGWAYLIFLLIIIPQALNYYRKIYVSK